MREEGAVCGQEAHGGGILELFAELTVNQLIRVEVVMPAQKLNDLKRGLLQ